MPAMRHNAGMSEETAQPEEADVIPNVGYTPQPNPKEVRKTVEEVLGSVHTSNFPDLLRELGGCLLVSTYQAGKLVILRPDGNSINTHFRTFNRPMGMAADRQT